MRVRPAVQCSATCKSSGERCRKFCAPGATVCHSHGGAAPQVQAAARRRAIEAKEIHRARVILATNSGVGDLVAKDLEDAHWASLAWDTQQMRRIANVLEAKVKQIRAEAKRIDREKAKQRCV